MLTFLKVSIYDVVMNKENAEMILAEFVLPEYRDIPDVGLYLDQVTRYLNRILNAFPKMQVTGSMISNYVKQKLLPKAVKKAYSKEQIAMLVIIVMSKRILSIDQIRIVMNDLNEMYEPETYYTMFRTLLQEAVQDKMEASGEKTCETLLKNIASGISHGMFIDKCLEEQDQ